MFGLSDLPKFFFAFFLVLPVITFLHEGGHVFFAWLMGGKNIKVTIGSGKVLFRLGVIEVRKYYFWYGLCSFDNLRRNERFAYILIFSGGILFNAVAVLILIYLIDNQYVDAGLITYQFTYFSLYFIFFALLPMPYPDGNYSDGKIILDLLRHKKTFNEKLYKVFWDNGKKTWCMSDENDEVLFEHEEIDNALEKAKGTAMQNRPSRLQYYKSEEDVEEHNFPRLPQ
jgi:hypothetical protein